MGLKKHVLRAPVCWLSPVKSLQSSNTCKVQYLLPAFMVFYELATHDLTVYFGSKNNVYYNLGQLTVKPFVGCPQKNLISFTLTQFVQYPEKKSPQKLSPSLLGNFLLAERPCTDTLRRIS